MKTGVDYKSFARLQKTAKIVESSGMVKTYSNQHLPPGGVLQELHYFDSEVWKWCHWANENILAKCKRIGEMCTGARCHFQFACQAASQKIFCGKI